MHQQHQQTHQHKQPSANRSFQDLRSILNRCAITFRRFLSRCVLDHTFPFAPLPKWTKPLSTEAPPPRPGPRTMGKRLPMRKCFACPENLHVRKKVCPKCGANKITGRCRTTETTNTEFSRNVSLHVSLLVGVGERNGPQHEKMGRNTPRWAATRQGGSPQLGIDAREAESDSSRYPILYEQGSQPNVCLSRAARGTPE